MIQLGVTQGPQYGAKAHRLSAESIIHAASCERFPAQPTANALIHVTLSYGRRLMCSITYKRERETRNAVSLIDHLPQLIPYFLLSPPFSSKRTAPLISAEVARTCWPLSCTAARSPNFHDLVGFRPPDHVIEYRSGNPSLSARRPMHEKHP